MDNEEQRDAQITYPGAWASTRRGRIQIQSYVTPEGRGSTTVVPLKPPDAQLGDSR